MQNKIKKIRHALLRWYAANKRDLPWRRNPTPYRVLVSEIMLQQTRVAAARDHYQRFLQQFPTIRHLAKARIDDVLTAWSGLGYYRRARSLHSTAREVVQNYGGRIPSDYATVTSLPGIGRYTAGAVLSIAYQRPLPLVDGNVARLLTRVFAIAGDPASSVVQKKLWSLAKELVPSENPGDFNQALMELPALLCTPRTPSCAQCPLAAVCIARAKGWQKKFPQRKKPIAMRAVAVSYYCLQKKNTYFFVQRQQTPMQGFWEFPSQELLGNSFSQTNPPKLLGKVRHSIMQQRISASYYAVEGVIKKTLSGRWLHPKEALRLPLTTLTKKALRFIDS